MDLPTSNSILTQNASFIYINNSSKKSYAAIVYIPTIKLVGYFMPTFHNCSFGYFSQLFFWLNYHKLGI